MAAPAKAPAVSAGYSGTPLAKKLGVSEDSTIALIGAPPGFTIPDLPPGVVLRRSARAMSDVTLWFVGSRAELSARVADLAGRAGKGAFWICWPKRSSGVSTDVTEHAVRSAGLANGLVDFKIAAIDATWSGLRFAIASGPRGRVRA